VLDDANATVGEQPVLRAPIRPRNNVMAVGKNFHEHAKEFADSGFDASATQTIPDHPIVFTKALTSLVGPGDAITLSADSTGTTDYEGELGVVIGARGTKIQKADAWEHVYGYTVINDVTARQVQKRHVQFFIGKSGATFCPMGPAIVTRDEIPDIESAWLRTTVNGDERQAAQIKDLIFDIPTLIASISDAVLLEPGDVIATGTPAGVGLGFNPPRFLQPGDVVDITIDGIGTLSNPVVA
jgi:2-keto-4-pentenoate hydratase/2-oxohepta-3-ene-1,7-dioic acid hydratase in catechol pathway